MNPQFQGPQHDKRRYVRIKYQGSSCVVPPESVAQLVAEDFSERGPGETYTTVDVWMTPHEYESLPEFMGW